MDLDPLSIDSYNSLTEIKGIGNKTSQKLKNHFGTEEKALRIIQHGKVHELTSSGLSDGKAARIIRNAVAHEYSSDDLLRTSTADKIYDKIQKRIKKNAKTDYGQSKLNIYFPTNSKTRIKEVRKYIQKIKEIKIKKEVENELAKVTSLKDPNQTRSWDRVMISKDPEKLKKANKVLPEVPTKTIENRKEIQNLVKKKKKVYLIDDSVSRLDIDSRSVEYKPGALEDPVEVVPEKTLSFFSENLSSIKNAIRVRKKIESEHLSNFTDNELQDVLNLLEQVDERGKVEGDEELQRVESILDRIDDVVGRVESELNQEIKEILEKREITIKGSDLLDLVSQGEEAETLARLELREEFEEIVEEKIDELVSELGLDFEEEQIALDIFPRTVKFPIKPNQKTLNQLKSELRKKYNEKSLEVKIEIARELKKYKEKIKTLVKEVLELDVALAIKKFINKNEMTLPKITEEKGFKISQGRNLFIQNPDPINYYVEDITLLSGVNSGGKTSTLDLITQTYILSHMGFPVPAKPAEVGIVDEIYYYRAVKRTMSSGAFESVLREFEDLLTSNKSKLVLVDELENITEPGASAKIIAGILENLKTNNDTTVFVTHLAEKIREESNIEIPVDGIEAQGLNEEMELMVNHSPKKNHLATSTPELVVKKLTNQNQSKFYKKLLKKFK